MSGSKSDAPTQPTADPTEMWWLYFNNERLDEGMSRSNWVDEAKAAFLAGWDAAMEATSGK